MQVPEASGLPLGRDGNRMVQKLYSSPRSFNRYPPIRISNRDGTKMIMQVSEASRHPPGMGGNRNGAKLMQVSRASRPPPFRDVNRNDATIICNT